MDERFQHDDIEEITQRIAELRDACGYTPEEFAAKLGLSVEEYKSYEQNTGAIPISLICNIAKLCGVELSEIMTGVTAKLHTLQVVRAGEAAEAARYPGYHLGDLAYRFAGKTMQPMIANLNPDDPNPAWVRHSGQEFNYVLEGTVNLHWNGKDYLLRTGDCAYFDATYPHGQRCGDDQKACFITVIAE